MNGGKKIFSVEGNIAAGKSSVLEKIKEKYTVYYEDINAWNFLDDFYEDKQRWACTLQTSILKTMYQQHRAILSLKDDVVFIERSPQSSLIFATLLKQIDDLNEKEYNLLVDLYTILKWEPTGVFFIDTPVCVCFQRMKKRCRPCEQNVDVDYLNRLHDLYMEKSNHYIFTHYKRDDGSYKTSQEMANDIMSQV